MIGYLRALLERVDSSLLEEWESLLHPELRARAVREPRRRRAPTSSLPTRARCARACAPSCTSWSRAGAARLGGGGAPGAGDPGEPWTPERFERALEPFLAEYGELVFTPRAREDAVDPDRARRRRARWRATQVLLDPDGDNHWYIEAEIDLSGARDPVGPLLRLSRIGT